MIRELTVDDYEIIGCILCGHDGRRGYLQHLVVRPDYRNKDIGNSFWRGKGWQFRDDVNMDSYNASENENV